MHRFAEMHRTSAHLTIEHCGLRQRHFLLRRRLAVAVSHGFDQDSVFVKFSPLQPANLAADAGTVEYTTATIAAAPINLLSMFSPFRFEQGRRNCQLLRDD